MTVSKHILLAACVLVCAAGVAFGNPGKEPGPATVASVQSGEFLVPGGFWRPSSLFPLGKQDYEVIARVLDRAAMLATGTVRINDAWNTVVASGDRVGLLLDARSPPASLTLVDALIDRLVHVGVRPANIIVWGDKERSLFSAGLLVRKDPNGIETMGADSEGFRGGLSRIVLNHCDVLVNVARLRVDSRIGMWGAVANQLACVPHVERLGLMANLDTLSSAAARATVKLKFRLHILDALQPNYDVGATRKPPYWDCGKLLASTDPVALDIIGRKILEDRRLKAGILPCALQPDPSYLASACDTYRLGQADVAQITVLEHTLGE